MKNLHRILSLTALGLAGIAAASLFPGSSAVAPAVGNEPAEALPNVPGQVGSREKVVPSRSGFYSAELGREHRFTLSATVSTEIGSLHAKELRPASIQHRIAGEMCMEVVGREAGDLIVAVRIDEPRVIVLQMSGERHRVQEQRMAASVARFAQVRMASDGTIEAFRFDAETDIDGQRFLRTLFASVTGVVRPDETPYETEETDMTGTAAFAYRRGDSDRVLTRSKLRFIALHDGRQPAHHSVRGSGTLELESGWVKSANWSEQQDVTMAEADTRIHMDLRVKTACVEVRDVAVGNHERFDHLGSWQPIGASAVTAADSAEAEKAMFVSKLEGVRVEDLIDEIQRLVAESGIEGQPLFMAREKLAWMIRLHPEQTSAVLDAALAAQGRQAYSGVLLSALGAAQQPLAQDALVSLVAKSHLPAGLRLSAVMSLSQVKRPTAGAIRLATSLASGKKTDDLRSSGMLLLGSLANGSTPASTKAFDVLVGMEARARKEGALPLWMMAMSNTKRPEAAPFVHPLVHDGAPQIRRLAIEILHQAEDRESVELLAASAIAEPVPVLRQMAMEVLEKRTDAYSREIVQHVRSARASQSAK